MIELAILMTHNHKEANERSSDNHSSIGMAITTGLILFTQLPSNIYTTFIHTR
jgi:hypothetical protein